MPAEGRDRLRVTYPHKAGAVEMTFTSHSILPHLPATSSGDSDAASVLARRERCAAGGILSIRYPCSSSKHARCWY